MRKLCHFFGYGECHGKHDRHHWIKQRRVRNWVMDQTGDDVLAALACQDVRNIGWVCRRHHDWWHSFRPKSFDHIPDAVHAFAADWGLEHSLMRDYGVRVEGHDDWWATELAA